MYVLSTYSRTHGDDIICRYVGRSVFSDTSIASFFYH